MLRKYVKSDPDVRYRKRGTFAITQSKEPEALAELISIAHNDESPSVRGEAIFWLAQIGGGKEVGYITAAVVKDSQCEVKKKRDVCPSSIHWCGEEVTLSLLVKNQLNS